MLTVAIATMAGRIESARQLSFALAGDAVDEILVVAQFPDGAAGFQANDPPWPDKVTLIVDEHRGLSRSRNIALREARGDHVWTVDDDVQFAPGACARVRELLKPHPCCIGLVRIGYSDGPGVLTSPRPVGRLGKLYLCRGSSIEMILPRRLVRERGLTFDERVGLGTRFPAGEENLFLFESDRRGLPVVDLGEVLIFHPHMRPRVGPVGEADLNLVKIRGHVARQVRHPLSFALALRWGIREFRRVGALRTLGHLFRGYLAGSTAALTGLPDTDTDGQPVTWRRVQTASAIPAS